MNGSEALANDLSILPQNNGGRNTVGVLVYEVINLRAFELPTSNPHT